MQGESFDGYRVQVSRRGQHFIVYLGDSRYGGRAGAQEKALAVRDGLLEILGVIPKWAPKEGKGVYRASGKDSYVASYKGERALFTKKAYGTLDKAEKAAQEWRAEQESKHLPPSAVIEDALKKAKNLCDGYAELAKKRPHKK